MPGTSPRDYVAHLADPGLAYEPDLVLIAVMANDVQDVWIQRRFGVRFASEVLRDVQRDLMVGVRSGAARRRCCCRTSTRSCGCRSRAPGARSRRPTPSRALPAPRREGPACRPSAGTTWSWPWASASAVAPTRRRPGARAPDRAHAIAAVATGAVSLDSEDGITGYLQLLAAVEPRLLADAVLLPAAYDDAWEETAGYLHTLVRLARRAGSRVAIVYVPAIHQVTEASRVPIEHDGFVWDPRTLTDTTLPDRLRAVATREDVAFVDLLPVFRAAPDRGLYFVRDGHWTPAGQRLAADTLATAVSGLLDAR